MKGIEPIQNKEFNKIWNEGFINLSVVYAKEYDKNPVNFITCFLKYGSVRSVCKEVVQVYKKNGAFADCLATGKDFTEYAEKRNVGKWTGVLADILLIIYCLKNETV